jgi:hypothetical protein
MKSVAAAFMTVRDASQIDGMPMSQDCSKVRFTLCGNTIDALPRCTGIYRFLGEQDQLLYIGKSVNIYSRYSRVRSHCARSGQGDRQRRMIHATRTVDCRPTAGEAGAQPFQESHLLHNWTYMGTYQDPEEALVGAASTRVTVRFIASRNSR